MLIKYKKKTPGQKAPQKEGGTRTGIKSMGFQKAGLAESSEALANPGCGWYHVYTFRAQPPGDGRPVEEEAWMDESSRAEQLALALVDIGDFKLGALTEDALLHIGKIMEFFRQNQKQLLLRFTYDTEGRGMEREPLCLSLVKRHMEQIGGAIRPYLEDILVLQGIFVGNWGEMHGSKFLDGVSMCRLAGTLYRVTQGRCFLAVRTPAQWRRITGSLHTDGGVEDRLGLFNDGIFGSPTDLGTYGTLPRAEAGEEGSWGRGEELAWQAQYMDSVPNGGEILSCKPFTGYRQAAKELGQMHAAYLNSIYHPGQLGYWRGEKVKEPGCWQGVSGYDYIGRHLGYRFTVLDVTEENQELRITIKNTGFGNLCQEAECFLVTEGEPGRFCYKRLDTDPREWKSGQESVVAAAIPQEGRSGGCRLYLLLKGKAGGRSIRFANQGAEEKVLLGELPGDS